MGKGLQESAGRLSDADAQVQGSSDESDLTKSDESIMSDAAAKGITVVDADVLLIKVYLSGTQSPIANHAAVIESPSAVTLSTVLQSKLTTDGFTYADDQIVEIKTTDGTNIKELLSLPCSKLMSILKKKNESEIVLKVNAPDPRCASEVATNSSGEELSPGKSRRAALLNSHEETPHCDEAKEVEDDASYRMADTQVVNSDGNKSFDVAGYEYEEHEAQADSLSSSKDRHMALISQPSSPHDFSWYRDKSKKGVDFEALMKDRSSTTEEEIQEDRATVSFGPTKGKRKSYATNVHRSSLVNSDTEYDVYNRTTMRGINNFFARHFNTAGTQVRSALSTLRLGSSSHANVSRSVLMRSFLYC